MDGALRAHIVVVETQRAKDAARMAGIQLKLLTADKLFCAILQSNIPLNGLYGECNMCKNCFDRDLLDMSLDITPTCPLCRAPWINQYVYRNSEAPIVEPVNI